MGRVPESRELQRERMLWRYSEYPYVFVCVCVCVSLSVMSDPL